MNNFTTNTYQIKREIVNFSKKICKNSNKPEAKFVTDMIYGISKSKDILLSSISEQLNEKTKKLNTIDRLSSKLSKDLSDSIYENYPTLVMDSLADNLVFLVDYSDIIKPLGEKFENLGLVRDGSNKNKTYEKEYISSNSVTKEGLNKVVALLNCRGATGTFVNDKGYDSNDIFNYYFSKKQHFVIRLTERRKVLYKNKWYNISTLRDSRKGKIKMDIILQVEKKQCFVSVLKVQITANKRWVNLVLVYGLGETPMVLATNISIKSKEDVIKVSKLYLNRWRIEEYFKFKKQEYNFEN